MSKDSNFYIGENDFRVWLPDVIFKSDPQDEDAYNSRQMMGIMTTERKDRQGEVVVSKGLDFEGFLHNGHFNDNHSQDTSKIVGYPEAVTFHKDLGKFNNKLKGHSGWTCRGYVLKGTRRSDEIWELAKALSTVPNKKLGFSIEGKVKRRGNKTIERADIRNVAITNCPVNTDCSWDVINKSFTDENLAAKSLMAGAAVSPATQTGGGALRGESLDEDEKDVSKKRKQKIKKAIEENIKMASLIKSAEFVLEQRPDFTEEAAAYLISQLHLKGGRL